MVMTDDGDAPWHGCARVRAEKQELYSMDQGSNSLFRCYTILNQTLTLP